MAGLAPLVTLVASSTTTSRIKAMADFVCDGTDDSLEINRAISNAAAAGGGLVQLTEGEYACNVGPVKTQRKVALQGSQYSATVLRGYGTWTAHDGTTPGGVIEPLDDHQDRCVIRSLTVFGNQFGSANLKGIYGNINTNTGFVYGSDSRWLVEDLFIYNTRSNAFELRGIYCRENTVRSVRVFDCGDVPSGWTAHGFLLEGQDSTFDDCNAGDCTGEGFWVTGVNHRFAMCKGWFSGLNGWKLAGVRNKLASCEAQDNTRNGFDLEVNDLNLTSCLGDSNSYDGSPSGAVTGRTYHGFYLNAGGNTLSACVTRDKDENARGVRQLYGYYLEAGAFQCQVSGVASNHWTGQVGGPGINGAGNNIQVTGDQGGTATVVRLVGSALGSEVTFWRSEAIVDAANQGTNLPVALTELDSGVLGTRKIVDTLDIGTQVQIAVSIRNTAATADTVTVSIRDTSNTANVLATVAVSIPASITTTVALSAYAAKPAWLTGTMTLAVYTSHTGAATLDYIFKDVTLRHRP